MDIWFNTDEKSLHLIVKDGQAINFFDWRQISYGSSAKKDLNLCSPDTYQYKLKSGEIPNLDSNNVTFVAQ
jgi:hypothetical protein